ncbi:hypothetical protein A8990_101195 [Paenibacillus taihuensis]|uniref:Uncharacterized protein n=1 Tax=Paenibacillus taihuensis TaxID=1156355 RepID=A0A3D9SRR1_9BACL|nr:hypothetical protein A8990_101195 [Paenibacillus taihuensis]
MNNSLEENGTLIIKRTYVRVNNLKKFGNTSRELPTVMRAKEGLQRRNVINLFNFIAFHIDLR